jgi:hypothetical protein
MESSYSTEELEGARERASADVESREHVASKQPVSPGGDVAIAAEGASTPVRPSPIASIREQCSACGAAMAPDQRYCVECGQRRGPARVRSLDGLAQRAGQEPAARRPPRRARTSVNSTLIAGVGTLLLALGVGVLIGRSGNNTSAKAPPAQVVTIAGGGGTANTAPTGTTPQQPSAGAAKAAGSGAASAAASAKSASKGSAAPLKAVKVGAPGKGPGYQHGHFTGNFFGPESEK